MDKQNKRRTITIKINGKERPMKNRQEPVSECNREQTQSRISEQVNLEAAAAKESAVEGEDFEWILPTDAEGTQTQSEQKAAKPPKQKEEPPRKLPFMNGKGKKINPERKKWLTTIFLIVIGAIVIGTIFGMTMMNIVLPDESAVQSSVTPAEQIPEKIPPAANGDNEVQLQPLTAYVVQAGIYSAKETAEAEQEKLRKDGLPVQAMDMSTMGLDGKYALFIGISGSISGAKNLSQELSAGGTETFAKEIKTGAKTVKGVAEEEKKLLELAPQLFQMISGNMASTLSEDNQAAFAKLENTMTAIDKEKLINESVLEVYSTLEEASSQYKKFQENPSHDTEIALQQHLLSFLAFYQNV